MKLSPNHLKRYKDITLLCLKHAQPDIASRFDMNGFSDGEQAMANSQSSPDDLVDDLEAMGPTFIKLGQLLSSRPDILPQRYLKALSRLQDKVKPIPYSDVEETIERELGVRISKAFSEFNPQPIAAASLGQVHAASLRDGRRVVVKVQRPNIRQQIAADFEALDEIAGFLERHTKFGRRYQFLRTLDEFRKTLSQELDYQREAGNLTMLASNLKKFPNIRIPLPIRDYTTHNVLTMDFISGSKVTSLSPLSRMDVNGTQLAEELFQAYLQQVLIDGLFHADPHPGNVFLTLDHKIALLDLGMTGHTSPAMQEDLLKLLLAISEGNSDEAADVAIRIGDVGESFNESEFRHRLNQLILDQRNVTLGQMDIGKTVMEVGRNAGENGLYVPTELTMLGKTLLQLDEIGRTLDPHFDPNESIRRNASKLMNQRMKHEMTAGKLFGSMLEMKQFATALPMRLNRIMDNLSRSEFDVKVKTPDMDSFVQGFQKVANRITTGLILASLIVGASLLMQVQTTFQLFGYPGLAMICFIAAASIGLWLVGSILWHDRKDRKKMRR